MNNTDLSVNFSELNSILDPDTSIGLMSYIVKKDDYINEQEIKALKAMNEKLTCEESLCNFYKKVSQDMKKPDLLGKTIQVTSNQF